MGMDPYKRRLIAALAVLFAVNAALILLARCCAGG